MIRDDATGRMFTNAFLRAGNSLRYYGSYGFTGSELIVNAKKRVAIARDALEKAIAPTGRVTMDGATRSRIDNYWRRWQKDVNVWEAVGSPRLFDAPGEGSIWLKAGDDLASAGTAEAGRIADLVVSAGGKPAKWGEDLKAAGRTIASIPSGVAFALAKPLLILGGSLVLILFLFGKAGGKLNLPFLSAGGQ